MMMSESTFKKLSDVKIDSMVKQKGKFWYMPWSNAVREVTKNFPDFTWEFTKWDSLPFLKTELGYFVECSATIDGVTKRQMMPVLDFKNKTDMSPTAFSISNQQMRALAKVIALFGLGLNLWAGEDVVGYGEIDRSEEYQEYSEKFNSLYEKNSEPLVLWGYIEQFRTNDDLSQYIYRNLPKGHKTKIGKILVDARNMFFDYKVIFEGGDESEINEAMAELSDIEVQIINAGIKARSE